MLTAESTGTIRAGAMHFLFAYEFPGKLIAWFLEIKGCH
jgi:hypothetical protein